MKLFNLIHKLVYRSISLNCKQQKPNNTDGEVVKKFRAKCTVVLGKKIFAAIETNAWNKGVVFSRAQLAGINSSGKAAELIPSLDHNVVVEYVGVKMILNEHNKTVNLTSTVKCLSKHDIDTEAMLVVAIAALTIFDQAKKFSQDVYIRNIELIPTPNPHEDDCKSTKMVEINEYDNTPITNDPVVVNYL